jgi:hypothetical protein
VKIHPDAPVHRLPYTVIEATAAPAGNSVDARTGKADHRSGVARVRREDGKQAVYGYDTDANEALDMKGDGHGGRAVARLTERGVDSVVAWTSPATARKLYRDVVVGP